MLSVLQQQVEPALPLEKDDSSPRPIPENRVAAGRNHFAQPAVAREPETPRFSTGASTTRPTGANYPNAQPGYQKQQGALYRKLLETPAVERKDHVAVATPSLEGHSQSFGRVLTIIAPDMALLERDGKLQLLALPVAERWLKQAQLTPGENAACAQPLLIPVRLKISAEETRVLQRTEALLAQMGIEMVLEPQHVTIRAVPLPLRQQNLQNLIPELIGYLAQQTSFEAANTAQWIARHLPANIHRGVWRRRLPCWRRSNASAHSW